MNRRNTTIDPQTYYSSAVSVLGHGRAFPHDISVIATARNAFDLAEIDSCRRAADLDSCSIQVASRAF
jgi:hypothetical protein